MEYKVLFCILRSGGSLPGSVSCIYMEWAWRWLQPRDWIFRGENLDEF